MTPHQCACPCRDFAQEIFNTSKREAASLDSAGWNVGSVVDGPRRSGTWPATVQNAS
jgi:hypothetical protein